MKIKHPIFLRIHTYIVNNHSDIIPKSLNLCIFLNRETPLIGIYSKGKKSQLNTRMLLC